MKEIGKSKSVRKVKWIYYIDAKKQQSANPFPHNTKANKASVQSICR